jgi:hypothetical protein
VQIRACAQLSRLNSLAPLVSHTPQWQRFPIFSPIISYHSLALPLHLRRAEWLFSKHPSQKLSTRFARLWPITPANRHFRELWLSHCLVSDRTELSIQVNKRCLARLGTAGCPVRGNELRLTRHAVGHQARLRQNSSIISAACVPNRHRIRDLGKRVSWREALAKASIISVINRRIRSRI